MTPTSEAPSSLSRRAQQAERRCLRKRHQRRPPAREERGSVSSTPAPKWIVDRILVLPVLHRVSSPRGVRLQWFSARSKMSKLRSRLPVGTSRSAPVEQQRHRLLRQAAVRAQRRVEARQVVARRAWCRARRAAPRRSRRRRGGPSAGSKRAAASARDSTDSMPGTCGEACAERGASVAGRQVARSRTSRASRGARRTDR